VFVEEMGSGEQPVFVFNEKEQTGGLITQIVFTIESKPQLLD
jgi:hypothetical protein